MNLRPWLIFLIAGCAGIFPPAAQGGVTNYPVRGVVKEIRPKEHQLVIAHEAIPDFMGAMTMPFNVRESAVFTNVAINRAIRFQLHVTGTESWIDHVQPLDVPASAMLLKSDGLPGPKTNSAAAVPSKNPLRDFKFTNELGQPVSLSDFRGQAVAITFIFTRCPVPEFCPRLTRNFEAVQRRLSAMENAPTNWHLLSITFDPEVDTPEVLKAYGTAYHYDPAHWSFLTGPKDKIAELARLCDVKFDAENGLYNHNFRTLIVNASNQLQMVFPTSGDLSESIVQELLKATGRASLTATTGTSPRPAADK